MNPFKTLVATAAVAALASGNPARAADGKTFLLTVAVGRTPNMPTFRPLPNAEKAATALHDTLLGLVPEAQRYGYLLMWNDRTGAPNPSSNQPTAKNVRSALQLFAREATAQDRVLVVFLGHGFHTVGGKGEPEHDAVVLGDSALNDPEGFLTVTEIFGRVTAMKCKDGAVFIDACRDFRDDLKVALDPAYRPTGKTFADHLDRQERQANRDRRVCLVQACEAGTYAYEEDDTKGGLMTESLTLALSKTRPEKEGTADIDGDGVVTIHEAVGYARTRVQIHARNRHRTVQKLTDEPAAVPFALANVDKQAVKPPTEPAAGGGNTVADSGKPNPRPTAPQAPALAYTSQTIDGGAPATPATTRQVVSNYNPAPAVGWNGGGSNGFAYGYGAPGVAFGPGINPHSPVGQVYTGVRQIVPGQALPYMPPPNTPVVPWALQQAGRFLR